MKENKVAILSRLDPSFVLTPKVLDFADRVVRNSADIFC